MTLVKQFQKLRLFDRNVRWLTSPLPLSDKLLYYFFMSGSMLRSAVFGKKEIRYLRNKVRYDNNVTPLTLQLYPDEIFHSILENVDSGQIRSALDIGGNIGQFSLTLNSALMGGVSIDILEPNPEIFRLLQQNTAGHRNIKVYNYGVGEPGISHMYYTPGQSGTGSVFKANTSQPRRSKKLKINLTDNPCQVTARNSYDLVKIDVEGYEYSLLEAIEPFKTKYMFIEVSLNRYRNYSHSDLFRIIEKKFGKFEIMHISGGEVTDNNFDILIRFLS